MPHLPGFLPDPDRCHQWPTHREPYVRAQLPDGRTVDGKADVWQGSRVLIRWPEDGDLPMLWMTADLVQRIPRSASSWHEPHDDITWYIEQGEA